MATQTISVTRSREFRPAKDLHVVVFVLAMLSFILSGLNAQAADLRPTDYRLALADDKFADTWQFAVAYRLRPPRRLRAQYLELAVGTISTSADNNLFVSLGPVWRLPLYNESLFVEFGISPTLLSGTTFNGRDMGGSFHFTSSAAIGTHFGARDAMSVSLRIQHMSNGGISSTNPGMDMVGITFAFDLFRR